MGLYKASENFLVKGVVDFKIFKVKASVTAFLIFVSLLSSYMTYKETFFLLDLLKREYVCGEVVKFDYFKQIRGHSYYYFVVESNDQMLNFKVDSQPRITRYKLSEKDVGSKTCIRYFKKSGMEMPNYILSLTIDGEILFSSQETEEYLKAKYLGYEHVFVLSVVTLFLVIPFFIRSLVRNIQEF